MPTIVYSEFLSTYQSKCISYCTYDGTGSNVNCESLHQINPVFFPFVSVKFLTTVFQIFSFARCFIPWHLPIPWQIM